MSRDKTESVVKKGRPGHGSAAGPVSTPAHDTASDQIELKIITMSGAPRPRWQRNWAKVSKYPLSLFSHTEYTPTPHLRRRAEVEQSHHQARGQDVAGAPRHLAYVPEAQQPPACSICTLPTSGSMRL